MDAEADEIRETIQAESSASYRDLFSPKLRPALRVGVGVPAFNQLVGVNAIIYYTQPSSSSPAPVTRPQSWDRSGSGWST